MKTIKELDRLIELELLARRATTPKRDFIDLIELWKADIIERDEIIDKCILIVKSHIQSTYPINCKGICLEIEELKKQLEGEK